MQAYGNLFQGRQNVAYIRANHAFKAGVEVRINRDTTYFGTSPNGAYSFGGGPAYATEAIPSQSGNHDVQPGELLPDTLSALLLGNPFTYDVAIAAPGFSGSCHFSGPISPVPPITILPRPGAHFSYHGTGTCNTGQAITVTFTNVATLFDTCELGPDFNLHGAMTIGTRKSPADARTSMSAVLRATGRPRFSLSSRRRRSISSHNWMH